MAACATEFAYMLWARIRSKLRHYSFRCAGNCNLLNKRGHIIVSVVIVLEVLQHLGLIGYHNLIQNIAGQLLYNRTVHGVREGVILFLQAFRCLHKTVCRKSRRNELTGKTRFAAFSFGSIITDYR